MRDIRIRPSGPNPQFAFIFKPILEDLNGYYWLVDDDTFHWPPEWGDQSTWDEKTGTYSHGPMGEAQANFEEIDGSNRLGMPQIMPLYAPYVKNDWTSLYAFPQKPENIKEWLEQLRKLKRRKKRAAFIAETVAIGLYNVDAAYWGIFTAKDDLVEKLASYLNGIQGVIIEEGNLEECLGI